MPSWLLAENDRRPGQDVLRYRSDVPICSTRPSPCSRRPAQTWPSTSCANLVPRIADQPLVASVVSGFGAGTVCDDPADLTAAVSMVLHAPELRARAEVASGLLERRPTPDAVWSALRDRM
jgi:hypothetical protein